MIRHNIKTSKFTGFPSRKPISGETIETKMERIVKNSEPITDGAPIIYMERKDGFNPEYDIRTDRFEVALDAMDIVHKSKQAKREERANAQNVQGTEPNNKPAA